MNKVIMLGRLTRDPETRITQTNVPVCKFSLAINRRGKDQTALFVDMEAWSKTAEFIQKFFTKGSMIAIDGRLDEEQWEKDGTKHRRTKVVVESAYFAEGRKNSDEGTQTHYQPQNASTGATGAVELSVDDADLPF